MRNLLMDWPKYLNTLDVSSGNNFEFLGSIFDGQRLSNVF